MIFYLIKVICNELEYPIDLEIYYSTSDKCLIDNLKSWIYDELFVCEHPNQLLRDYFHNNYSKGCCDDEHFKTLEIKNIFDFFYNKNFSEYPVDQKKLFNHLKLKLDDCYSGSYMPPIGMIEFMRSNFPNEPLPNWC